MIEDAPTRFAFPEPSRIAPPILALEHVDVGYDGVPVLRDLSLTVDMDDRIALLGQWKWQIHAGEIAVRRLDPLQGELRRGRN